MMFSERLEYGKYDFQHLQGTLRCVYGHQKPDVLRVYNENQSGWISLFRSFPFLKKHIFCVRKIFGEKKSEKIFSSKIKSICLELQHNQRRASNSFSKSFFHQNKVWAVKKAIVDIGVHMMWASDLPQPPCLLKSVTEF